MPGIDDQLAIRPIAFDGEAELVASGVDQHEPAGDGHTPALDDLIRDRSGIAQDAELRVDQQRAVAVDRQAARSGVLEPHVRRPRAGPHLNWYFSVPAWSARWRSIPGQRSR